MRPPVGQPFFLEDPPGVETAMVGKPAGATEDLVFTALGFRISRLLRFCALAIINTCEYWLVIRYHDMLGDRKSVAQGTRVSVRVDLGGPLVITHNKLQMYSTLINS